MKAEVPSATPKRIRPDRHADFLHVGIIVACGTAFRLIYQMAYKPWWSADSRAYSDIFYLWTHHTYTDAERTPVYPLFLGFMQWWAGNSPVDGEMSVLSQYLAVRLQCLLGLLAALITYFALRALGIRPKLSLAGGICFALVGSICLFELRIMSELLTLFFLTLGILFFLRCMRGVNDGTCFVSMALLSGSTFSFAILTRPENLVFVLVLTFVLIVLAVRCRYVSGMQRVARSLLRAALLMVVSAAPLVLCWMFVNLVNIGQFRINTYNGLLRTETTYNMFYLVDTEDQVAGRILWRSYLSTNGDGHIKRDHVWTAIPDLRQAWEVGLLPISSPNLNRPENVGYLGQVVDFFDYLGHLSWTLAKRHPLLYLRNVLNNFASDTFDWRMSPPSPSETEDPRAPEGGSVVRHETPYHVTVWISRLEAPLLTASYLVLLGYALFSPLLLLNRERNDLLRDSAVVAIATGAFATILCFCAVAAYFPEHGVPFTGMLIICVVYTVSNSKRIVQFWKPQPSNK